MDKLEQELDKELSKKSDILFELDWEKILDIFKYVYEKQEMIEDMTREEVWYLFNLSLTIFQYGVKKMKLKGMDKELAKVLLKRFKLSCKIYKLMYN